MNVILSAQMALANVMPIPAEFAMRDTWLANTFGMKEMAKDSNAGLFVSKNHILLQQNARFGNWKSCDMPDISFERVVESYIQDYKKRTGKLLKRV